MDLGRNNAGHNLSPEVAKWRARNYIIKVQKVRDKFRRWEENVREQMPAAYAG